MDFFISSAMAQDGAAAGDPGIMGFLPLIVILVVFYFLLIRPQQKRAKEHRSLLEALKKGDEIITTGGMAGTIVELGDSFVTVQVAENVAVKVQRVAISNLLPKGTLKKA